MSRRLVSWDLHCVCGVSVSAARLKWTPVELQLLALSSFFVQNTNFNDIFTDNTDISMHSACQKSL